MKKNLFFFAATCWLLAFIAHVLSVLDVDVSAKVPYIWVLHIGIFVVWIPAVLMLKNNDALVSYRQSARAGDLNPFGFFRIIFQDAPVWLKILAFSGMFYAVVNFMLFAISQHGTAEIEQGRYILQEKGKFIRTITEAEYHHFKANDLRGFSGHWLAFYGIAAAILYPFKKNKPV